MKTYEQALEAWLRAKGWLSPDDAVEKVEAEPYEASGEDTSMWESGGIRVTAKVRGDGGRRRLRTVEAEVHSHEVADFLRDLVRLGGEA